MTAKDQAPRSSALVRARLARIESLDYRDLLAITVTTTVDYQEQAYTTVSRPLLRRLEDQSGLDKRILVVLRSLPGAAKTVTITMGREYNVTWNGVRAPV